jgi:hypothetical protein
MDLLQTLLQAQGGGAVQSLAQRFGLNEDQVTTAMGALLPAVAGGLRQNAATEQGLGGLLGALSSGNHQQYVDDPSTLQNEQTTMDGNAILGHLFGSKETSRAVASQASAQTGLGEGVLKQMLPIVAAMAMGALSKQQSSAPMSMSAGGGLGGMLGGLLDRNQDGSVVDDVAGILGNFLKR